MRVPLLFSLFAFAVSLVVAAPAQGKSILQTGSADSDSKPFVEEVVVESVLHVRSPSNRQARTNTKTSLKDGTSVAEMKNQ